MDTEFRSTRKEEVWEKHAHFRDDEDDGDVVMMMVVAAANTYPALARSPVLAAACSISPPG